ncbi:MAG: glycerol kinase GlpK [Alphaproteobacteria bacterium]|nr:glycerol kinase GlpK [Alphaproteobacteria bacterium]
MGLNYFMALDQGTTSSRAMIFDEEMREIAHCSLTYPQYYPQNGYVEHNPEDLIDTIFHSALKAMTELRITAEDIKAIGITNQRETTLVWDKKTGKCIHNAIVWQCRRTADICKRLKEEDMDEYIQDTTGLVIDPYFSGTKVKWLLDNIPDARKRAYNGELLFGTVDTYLLWKLTNGKVFATDYTNASRTMLFNIHTLDWDDTLLEKLDIPRCMLPKVQASASMYGECEYPWLSGIPIAGIAGDQQGALFGQECDKFGDMKITYGTGAFLLLNTKEKFIKSKHGLVTTLGAGTQPGHPEYVLEGSVFMAGAIFQWLRDQLGILSDVKQASQIASSIKSTGGVCMVPAFTGLGAPHWNADVRATITGMTRATTAKEIIRAAEEAVAFQCYDLFKVMEQDLQQEINHIRVDGGASKDDFLMQFQSDLLNREVERPTYFESTARGGARLARQTLGLTEKQQKVEKSFNATISDDERKEHLKRWNNALNLLLK